MKINVTYIESEYKASWWWNGLYDNATEVAEWISGYCFCDLCQDQITAMCNNGGCS